MVPPLIRGATIPHEPHQTPTLTGIQSQLGDLNKQLSLIEPRIQYSSSAIDAQVNILVEFVCFIGNIVVYICI